MTALGTIALGIYIIGAPIVGIYTGLDIYRLPRKPAPFSGSMRGGNPRSATLAGIVYGFGWPLLVFVILPLVAFAQWVEKGGNR